MGLLDGRVAIVTGGAGNLGAHISRLFAAQGAGVVVNDVNAGSGARVVGEIEAAGGRGCSTPPTCPPSPVSGR
jgi:2-keto-3-deoxy-L-fuconate dehydrogenase